MVGLVLRCLGFLMGSDHGHESDRSPFSGKGKGDGSEQASSSDGLSAEAERLAREQLIRDSALRPEYPGLNAMAARAAYYGLQGRLFPNMNQIAAVMLESGPVGQAAHARMQSLTAKGWSFGNVSPADSYIGSQARTPLGRLAYSMALGGYNDAASGKIAHNGLMSMVNTIMGVSNGADVDAANKYIHELAHGKYQDGYAKFEASPQAREEFRKLSPSLQKVHAAQMIQEELRAISAQIAANSSLHGERFQIPQNRGLANYAFESALKQGELGGLVKDVWMYEGNKAITKTEANAAVRDYLKRNYGELFVNGKLNPRAEMAIAAEISKLQVDSPVKPFGGAAVASAETAFSAPRYMNYLSHGAQSLGSLLVLTAVADVDKQFKISTGSGVARLTTVGADWAGFEAGAAVGGWFGEGLASRLVRSNPKLAMIALPLTALGTGIVGSQIMHSKISKPLEPQIQKALDKLLEEKK